MHFEVRQLSSGVGLLKKTLYYGKNGKEKLV